MKLSPRRAASVLLMALSAAVFTGALAQAPSASPGDAAALMKAKEKANRTKCANNQRTCDADTDGRADKAAAPKAGWNLKENVK